MLFAKKDISIHITKRVNGLIIDKEALERPYLNNGWTEIRYINEVA